MSMVGVALPSIRSALGLNTSSLQWIVSGLSVCLAGVVTADDHRDTVGSV
jgi:hypothetical protein